MTLNCGRRGPFAGPSYDESAPKCGFGRDNSGNARAPRLARPTLATPTGPPRAKHSFPINSLASPPRQAAEAGAESGPDLCHFCGPMVNKA